MKRLTLFISILLFISCTPKSNEVELFNNISFKMQMGEKLTDIEPNIKEFYSEYFNSTQPQIPLFRYVKHADYKIFIGIPYNASISSMLNAQLVKPDSLRLNLESDSSCIYTKYKKDKFYITEYATVFKNKTIIYLSTMTEKKAISDSLFNKSDMLKRLILKAE